MKQGESLEAQKVTLVFAEPARLLACSVPRPLDADHHLDEGSNCPRHTHPPSSIDRVFNGGAVYSLEEYGTREADERILV